MESREDWPRCQDRPLEFLGQINFRELPPHVLDAPRSGLLVLFVDRKWPCDQPVVCRWYPRAESVTAVEPYSAAPQCARFEARITFIPSWDLPDPVDVESILGATNLALWQELVDWKSEFDLARGRADGSHELFPHTTSALLHESRPVDSPDARALLRVGFDVEAGFHWGSNVLYVLITNADLHSGHLDRINSRIADC